MFHLFPKLVSRSPCFVYLLFDDGGAAKREFFGVGGGVFEVEHEDIVPYHPSNQVSDLLNY